MIKRNVFLLLTFFWSSVSAGSYICQQELISAAKPSPEEKHARYDRPERQYPLKTILNELSEKYRVKLNYLGKTVNGIEVISPESSHFSANFEKALINFLSPLELVCEKSGKDQYIIYAARELPLNKTSLPEASLSLSKINLADNPVAAPELAQQTVSGQVRDQDGVPLPGVSVTVKGTQNGVSTDAEGNFLIENTPGSAVLVFSFLGYKTLEVDIAERNMIDVTMELDVAALDQVVVVGYGTQKRSDLTGSVSSADMEIFEESPNVNILESLHGSVAGLNVGAVNSSGENPSINIRGQNNFAGQNAPLIVLDGIIYRGNLNDINPNDIKSIDILKDASAASVYGSQAANGVILITSKNGGAGEKPIINYSASYSMQEPSNLVRPAGGAANIKSIEDSYWQQSRLGPDYLEPNPDFDPTVFFKTPDYVNGYNRFIESGEETDWWNLLTGNAYIQDHFLSVRGQGENVNYYFSGGLTDQNGLIDNDNYKRYSVRMNLSSDVKEWLNIGINAFATKSDYSGLNVDQNELFEYHPFLSPRDENGELILRPDGLRLNPFHISQVSDMNDEKSIFATFHADIKPSFLKGFNYRLNIGNVYRSEQHYQFDPWASDERGEGFKDHGNYYNLTWDNIFTYGKTFGDEHNLDLTLVYGIEKREGETTHTFARDFENKQLGYHALEQGNAEQYSIDSDAWEETSLYTMGRVAYTFKDKYLFTGTLRRDGFSGFGENNKIGIFPSAALGWIASRENFIRDNVQWINHLKLRGSYGTTARRSLDRYQTLARVSSEYSYVFGNEGQPQIGQWLSSMPNAALKWETTTGINLGLDYDLFESRINGSIEYYNSDTKDILYDISLPRMTGFSSIATNIGKVHNHGFEFTLNGAIIRNKEIHWNAGINFSANRNRIVSIIGADFNNDGIEDDLISDNLFIGEPIGIIYGYVNTGMWQLADEDAGIIPDGFRPGTYKVKDLDGDGEITTEGDRKILGYTQPAYRLSFSNSLRYGNFTLRIFINAVQGGKHYYYSTENDPGGGSGDNWDNRNKPRLWDYWLPENPDAYYRRLDLTSSHHQSRLAQRNFIRLQNVSLSYNFQADILKKIRVSSLKVYLSGKNLATLAPQWDGWDPETGQGYSSEGTPVLRNYTLGLNVEF